MQLEPVKTLRGTVQIPADKSISHRAVMFGALANGTTRIENCLLSADCRSTISCFSQMGISISVDEATNTVLVNGKGLHGLNVPDAVLNTGNSGTTTRLMSGILVGQSFSSTLSGDASLNSRPMKRIMTPLSQMGADIISVNGNDCAPLAISPHPLLGIHYHSPIASAQVKSAVLLAGLYAKGQTSVTEPALSRDHTERMLSAFGATITNEGTTATVIPEPTLTAQDITVPGDISSAAFFLAAGVITPGAELLIENVGINDTRAGILRVCEAMGADVTMENKRLVSGEPVCDLIVKGSTLHGTTIEGEMIPTLIDEIPVIAVMACFASGTTIIRDAADLKAKESDRIATVCAFLSAMGADITATDDGMIIHGTGALHGATVDSYDDHRIAMAVAVASLNAKGTTELNRSSCVNISYPNFYEDLASIRA